MSNLLYKEYKTGCYNYNNNGTIDRYEYGNSDSSMASYYADLLPNRTYTLKKWDYSSRFRVALYTNDVKSLTGSGYDYSITQQWLSDNTDTITFTTGSNDIYLVVYYTNNSEYTTRIMLNIGSVADAYEAPTKSIYPPEWYMDGDQPTPISALPILQDRFVKPYPASLWRIDESNDGLPYNDLMPGILYHEPEPPPPPEPTEIPTVQPTATTEITDQTSLDYRRYMNGYTNPNLYRFRDGELPENTECDVFIKGTHSHRYTSINDYEDFSTECEIP